MELALVVDHDTLRDELARALRRCGWFACVERHTRYRRPNGWLVNGRVDFFAANAGDVIVGEIDGRVPRWKSVSKAALHPRATKVFVLRGMRSAAETTDRLVGVDRWIVIDAWSGRTLDPWGLMRRPLELPSMVGGARAKGWV